MEIRVHKHLLYTYLKGNSFDLEELFANRIFHKMMVIKQREVKSNILLDSLGSGKTIKLITEFIANQQESLYITKNSRLKKNVVECILKMGFPVDNKRVINIGNPKIKLDQNIDIKHFYIDDLLFYTNKEINDVIELINKHIIKGSIIHVASSAIINKIPLLFEFINKYEFSLEYEYQKMGSKELIYWCLKLNFNLNNLRHFIFQIIPTMDKKDKTNWIPYLTRYYHLARIMMISDSTLDDRQGFFNGLFD